MFIYVKKEELVVRLEGMPLFFQLNMFERFLAFR